MTNAVEYFRNVINLLEARIPDTEYIEKSNEVVVRLKSYNSQIYTKLAQKFERIRILKEEVKKLEEEVKSEVKSDIVELFDATDAVKTRIVETLSFAFTLSKDPEPSKTYKYAKIIEELEKSLTPELIVVLENLKTQFESVVEKDPSIRVKKISEGIIAKSYAYLKSLIEKWCSAYDRKLDKLKTEAAIL